MTVRELINNLIRNTNDLESEVNVICSSFSAVQTIDDIDIKKHGQNEVTYIIAK